MRPLNARGHKVRLGEQIWGLHGIQRIEVHEVLLLYDGADPRREGVVKAD